MSCMQFLTSPAPRLWPEQYTLVGGVALLMLSTTLLQSERYSSQSGWSVLCFSMISRQEGCAVHVLEMLFQEWDRL